MTSEKNKKNVTQNATKQEIGAALRLIGLLYEQGEIPKHVYRNICNEYYDKGLDKVADARYTTETEISSVTTGSAKNLLLIPSRLRQCGRYTTGIWTVWASDRYSLSLKKRVYSLLWARPGGTNLTSARY